MVEAKSIHFFFSSFFFTTCGYFNVEIMRIAILGNGKMGKIIAEIAIQKGHEVVLRIGAENAAELTIDRLKAADVAIEFSVPEMAVKHIQLCLAAKVPVVVGTTGWYEHFEEVAKDVKLKRGAMLTATNFSLGVNLFFSLNEWLAKSMVQHPEYAVRIDETHHVHKLDAPSGTAISIAERLLLHLNKKGWSLDGEQPDSIPVFAHRMDEVPGTHEVCFTGPYDEIKLVHTAHNRLGFASGALVAAAWLPGKTGLFTMRDVLGL